MPHLSAYRKSQLCFCPTPLSQTYLTTITSIMSIAMLIIGMGIVMVPPMILEALYSYSPDNETVIEEATNSPLMMSTLPTLASALILGLIGRAIKVIPARILIGRGPNISSLLDTMLIW
jgi:hypothetical protein